MLNLTSHPLIAQQVLCLSQYGIFIFETKAISILTTTPARDTKRRVKNLHKQIKKALGQLSGAVRSLRDGNEVITGSGTKINFDRSILPHMIIVVSELLPFGDWSDIVSEAIGLVRKSNVMVHILDLRELTLLVAVSENADAFDYNLMKRFRHFIQCKSVFIRSLPPKRW